MRVRMRLGLMAVWVVLAGLCTAADRQAVSPVPAIPAIPATGTDGWAVYADLVCDDGTVIRSGDFFEDYGPGTVRVWNVVEVRAPGSDQPASTVAYHLVTEPAADDRAALAANMAAKGDLKKKADELHGTHTRPDPADPEPDVKKKRRIRDDRATREETIIVVEVEVDGKKEIWIVKNAQGSLTPAQRDLVPKGAKTIPKAITKEQRKAILDKHDKDVKDRDPDRAPHSEEILWWWLTETPDYKGKKIKVVRIGISRSMNKDGTFNSTMCDNCKRVLKALYPDFNPVDDVTGEPFK